MEKKEEKGRDGACVCVVIKIRFPRTAAGVGRVSRQGAAHAKVIKDVVVDDAGEILYYVWRGGDLEQWECEKWCRTLIYRPLHYVPR